MKIQNIFYMASSTLCTIASSICTINAALITMEYAIKFFHSLKDASTVNNIYFHAAVGTSISTFYLFILTCYCFNKALSYYEKQYGNTIDLSSKQIEQIEGLKSTLGI